MRRLKFFLVALCLILTSLANQAFSQNFHLKEILRNRPNIKMNVSVQGKNLQSYSDQFEFKIKRKIGKWTIIHIKPEQLVNLIRENKIDDYVIDFDAPRQLNDSARAQVGADSIHSGAFPLEGAYKGSGTIVGIIDTGIDFNHEDFKNVDGSTRILHYWDQELIDTNSLYNPALVPTFGYGQSWDSSQINSGNCLSIATNLHGTHVGGTASGNGLASGKHKGMAPEANIVVVQTDFNNPNWSLSVAEACDYIFHIADSLNMPASINISLGSYLGSHDGQDVATKYMESLLDGSTGKNITCAVGNSGLWGKYHVQGNITSDTSFVWFDVNPSSAFGNPASYFDMWADTNEFNDVKFAFGAHDPNTFEERGRTSFYSIQDIIGANFIDSIMSFEGDRMGIFEVETGTQEDSYHLEFFMPNPDSADYLFSFITTGEGKYDAWATSVFGISNFISSGLPSVNTYPKMEFYNYPDSLQTIISRWACSDKIVTVGYSAGHSSYIDFNGVEQQTGDVPTGHLSLRSAKGPTRKGLMKPDVVAPGIKVLSAAPVSTLTWYQTNAPSSVAEGGMHLTWSGSSMSSPVVAGVASLYFEKCPNASNLDFINAIKSTAKEDEITGSTPNFAWGWGKFDGFKTLVGNNIDYSLTGPILCDSSVLFSIPNADSVFWSDNTQSNPYEITVPDLYSAEYYQDGCKWFTNEVDVNYGNAPLPPVVSYNGSELSSSSGPLYQWLLDGNEIDGATQNSYIPNQTGIYTCRVSDSVGCEKTSNFVYVLIAGVGDLAMDNLTVYPNPSTGLFAINGISIDKMEYNLFDINGRKVKSGILSGGTQSEINITHLQKGIYQLVLQGKNQQIVRKLVKK